MASVVFLRGVNVGGHKIFRPSLLTEHLKPLQVINIGAAGTFVVRNRITPKQLRDAFAGSLPFEAKIMICKGREIAELVSRDCFAGIPAQPDIVRFVSILSEKPRSEPSMPMNIPSKGEWMLKVLSRDNRFIIGLYRRHMKAIGHLGLLDRLFGVPVTTRNWNTIITIARTLSAG